MDFVPPPQVDTAIVEALTADDIEDPANLGQFKVATFPLHGHREVNVWITEEGGILKTWLEGTDAMKTSSKTIPMLTTLFAFNTGSWSNEETSSHNAPFIFAEDTQCISVLANDGSRRTSMVCVALYDIYKSGRQGRLAWHTLSQLEAKSDSPHQHRYAPTVVKHVAFVPDDLDMDSQRGKNGSAEAGALFKGRMEQIPKLANVVFDAVVVAGTKPDDNGAVYSVLKPKHAKAMTMANKEVPKGKCILLK